MSFSCKSSSILMKNNIDETIKLADSGLFDLIKSGQLDISVLNQIYSRKDANRFVSDMTFDNIKKIHSDQTIVKNLSSETDLKNISTHLKILISLLKQKLIVTQKFTMIH